MSAEEFAGGVERLINQVGHWELGRWNAPANPAANPAATPGGGSRGDQARVLVQQLADLCAELEGNPRREVPSAGLLVIPDQIRVMADDLLTANPPETVLRTATAAVTATRQAL